MRVSGAEVSNMLWSHMYSHQWLGTLEKSQKNLDLGLTAGEEKNRILAFGNEGE
jgi:hypothetical protein